MSFMDEVEQTAEDYERSVANNHITINDGGGDCFDFTIRFGGHVNRYTIHTKIDKMKRLWLISGLDHTFDDGNVLNFTLHNEKDVNKFMRLLAMISDDKFDEEACQKGLMIKIAESNKDKPYKIDDIG